MCFKKRIIYQFIANFICQNKCRSLSRANILLLSICIVFFFNTLIKHNQSKNIQKLSTKNQKNFKNNNNIINNINDETTQKAIPTSKSLLFVLITAVYNRKSRLYSDNKIVLLINAPVDTKIDQTTFVAKTTNANSHNDYLQTNFGLAHASPPNIFCKWTTYIAVFDSVVNPKSLEIGHGTGKSVPVEIQLPYLKKQVKVGTCFSPLFLAEHWQLVVLAIEIYRYYGIQLQVVYLMSAIEGIYEILKAYNSRDDIQLEPWSSIEIDGNIHNEMNLELDWRNQAAAHTDCLMKYGYSAEFLIVGDMDDILVPDDGKSYYSEFVRNDYQHKRNAVALLYSRFTVDITTTRNPAKFSLFDALSSAKVAFYQPDDPKYVVNTSRAEALWLHWPSIIKPYTASRSVPSTDGRMLHFRNWHFLEDENDDGTPSADSTYMHREKKNEALWRSVALNESFISTKTARRISKRFEFDIFTKNSETFRKLRKKVIYIKIMTKCYDKIFYLNDKQVTECPGPHRCRIKPINGIKCYIAKRQFIEQMIGADIFLYTSPNGGKFKFSLNGCSL